MQQYWKLIGSIVGSAVAIVMVYLGSKGLGTCDAAGNCTVFGFTTAQVTGFTISLLSAAFVHYFPANQPPVA